MGITASFMLKHIRPIGPEAAYEICRPTGELAQFLAHQGVDADAIGTAFAAWSWAALRPLRQDTLGDFVDVALNASIARREELYPVTRSTVLFLNEPLLRELSYVSSRNRGSAFCFSPHEYIPLAVTSLRNGRVEYELNVDSVMLAADADGNCIHFESIECGVGA